MKKLLTLTLCILTAGILPVVFNIGSLGTSDFINQQIPFILETKRLLFSGTPFWSWNTFSGGNFIGQYAFYTLTSPFVWVAALFPYKGILWGVLLALYLKCCASAAATFLYLRKFGFSEAHAVTGALFYTFSCFTVSNLYYFHFAEPMIMFPLLLWAVENAVQGGRRGWAWIVLTAFGAVFINYYFAPATLILGFVYLVIRAVACRHMSLRLLAQATGAFLLGIMLAAFILVPVVYEVLQTARGVPGKGFAAAAAASQDGAPGGMAVMGAKMLPRFLSLLFPTVYESSPGDSLADNSNWTSTEAYLMIFGYLTAILHFRVKRNWLSWLIAGLTIIYLVPPLNGVFTLFTSLTYGRWLYGLLLLMIVAALELLKEGVRLPAGLTYGYVMFCLAAMGAAIVYSLAVVNAGERLQISPRRWVELAVILVNFGCLAIWQARGSRGVGLLQGLAAFCGVVNLWAFACLIIPWGEAKGSPAVHPDQWTGNSDMEYRHDDLSAYSNIAMLTDRPGIYSMHSVYPKSMIPFRAALDDDLTRPSFENRYGHRSSVDALMSVKNIRIYDDFTDTVPFAGEELTLIERMPEYSEFSFGRYIPMGFAYDSYVDEEEIMQLLPIADSIDIPALLLDNLAIRKEDQPELGRFLKPGRVNLKADIDSLVVARREFTVADFKGTSVGFTGTTDFSEPKVIFFSVPYDEGFKATIDGERTALYPAQLGMTAIVVPQGLHSIRFEFRPRGLTLGVVVSGIGLLILAVWLLLDRRFGSGITSRKGGS